MSATAQVLSETYTPVKRLARVLVWPGLFILCLLGTGLGIHLGHGFLGFNISYFSLAVALFFLERWLPHEKTWLANDGQVLTDLAHTLLNKGLVQVVVLVGATVGLAQMAAPENGMLWPNAWPMWAQILFALVVAELGLYWAHRLAHVWPLLWRFHSVHHSAPRLWFWNTGRFHFVDTFTSIALSLPLLFILGAPEECFLWLSAVTAFIGMLTHCNVDVRCGWLSYVFNTPNLHRWHHSRKLSEGNMNYGENLMIFDQLFGTFFISDRRPPADIGISGPMPANFLGQLRQPFLPKN